MSGELFQEEMTDATSNNKSICPLDIYLKCKGLTQLLAEIQAHLATVGEKNRELLPAALQQLLSSAGRHIRGLRDSSALLHWVYILLL